MVHASQAPCVIPVSARDALDWAAYKLHDADLLLRSALVPEAIFIASLPDRASYRECMRQAIHWFRQGAVCLICRTATREVEIRLEKLGAVPTCLEPSLKRRWLAGPDALRISASKLTRLTRPVHIHSITTATPSDPAGLPQDDLDRIIPFPTSEKTQEGGKAEATCG